MIDQRAKSSIWLAALLLSACGEDSSSSDGNPVLVDVPAGTLAGNDGTTGPVAQPGTQMPGVGDGSTDTAIPPADTGGTDGQTPPAQGMDGMNDGAAAAGVGGDGDGDGDAMMGGDGDGSSGVDPSTLEPFSFFVTSLEIMQELSGSQDGFGGNLGGLSGADDICQQAADRVGFGAKTWRAFLSATDDGSGNPVHAIDRIGDGPWYDRNGRLIAENRAGLLQERPDGDAQAVNDLANEHGEGLMQFGDTHDIVTGTNAQGQLDSPELAKTCNDWTSTTVNPSTGDEGGGTSGGGGWVPGGGFGAFNNGVRVGHSWPAMSGTNWMTAHTEGSCAAGVNLVQNGPGDGSSIGAGGGWGAIYCFALQP
jgi:hypothetical protein